MLTTKFFPTLLIILDVFAAAAYAWHGFPKFAEWRKTVYWLSAAVLTFTVTY